MPDLIKPLQDLNFTDFSGCYTSCIILTKNNQIMLQQRGFDWHTFPGFISAFGGKVEVGESPGQAIARELHEEVGAVVLAEELIFLGAYTEKITHYKDVVFGYFWHDITDKITGCYEGEAVYFGSVSDVIKTMSTMDDVCWLLNKCQQENLLPDRG